MEIASLFNSLNGPMINEVLIWVVAGVTGAVGLVALVNAVDMFIDAEAG